MKLIPLTRGLFTMVDDEDYDYLMQWKWYAQPKRGTFYAIRGIRKGKSYTNVRMHRLVMNAPKDKQVDHINHDGLNNQKYNLRVCLSGENTKNRNIQYNNTSGYKGVVICVHKRRGKVYSSIQAGISINNKSHYIGAFKTLEDAARAYDDAARRYYGEFANLNFPETHEE
jgi:predicted transposase YbfD/YdcC